MFDWVQHSKRKFSSVLWISLIAVLCWKPPEKFEVNFSLYGCMYIYIMHIMIIYLFLLRLLFFFFLYFHTFCIKFTFPRQYMILCVKRKIIYVCQLFYQQIHAPNAVSLSRFNICQFVARLWWKEALTLMTHVTILKTVCLSSFKEQNKQTAV